jgi:hypothetical protein
MEEKMTLDQQCEKCGQIYGMTFYEDRRIPGADGFGDVIIGRLSCPVCGFETIAYSQSPPGDNLI